MKKLILLLPLVLITLITCSSKKNEEMVRNYVVACNYYNYKKASSFLDSGYKEVFINGDIEIEDLDQLIEFIEWRKVMESKSNILSIETSKDTVITIEEISNFMDKILERKPRTFKIKYILKEEKILKSIIDTIVGYAQTLEFNKKKFNDFENYCSQNGLEAGMGMTRDGAIILKESLIKYKNNR